MRLQIAPQAAAPDSAARRARRWWLCILGFCLLLIWPLQVLTIAMIAVSALIAVSTLALLAERRGASVRAAPILVSATAVLSIGTVPTLLWPLALAPVAFILLVITCVTWLAAEHWPTTRHLVSERLEHRRDRLHVRTRP